jgi:hypothetical protein
MSLKQLRHSAIAIWLGLFTLAVIGLEQYQLAGNVMAAAVAEPHGATQLAHHTPDCPMHDAAGHTHKGHADCAVCGVLATLAAVTLPTIAAPTVPRQVAESRPIAAPIVAAIGRPLAPYSSRGPPTFS